MRQMKKKIIIAIIVTLLVTAGVAFTMSHFVIKSKDEEIQTLKEQAVDTKCLAFASDLKADSILTQSDITEIEIKLTNISSGTYIANGSNVKHYITFIDENGNVKKSETTMKKEDLIGRTIKSNVSKNTLILDSLLYNEGEEPTKDERLQEFNFLQLPSDLVENEYIDIRIQFPTGEDYSVLIGKKVEKIAGENTIFIKMNEEEIMTMGSAIIEAYMQTGVKLYANKYTDPATQLFNEEIIDYVAKYDYAVEKLTEELENKELRKEIAKLILDNSAEGKITIAAGNPIDVAGTLAVADTEIVILMTEDEEGTKYITEEMLALIPTEIKLKAEDKIERISVEDLKPEDLVKYAGIKKDYIEEIKLASEKNDENILNYYKVMRVQTIDQIIRSYPVKEEVLAVVKNNPNLLETIKAEFDATALLNTRIDEYKELEAQYNAAFDEYTKEQIKQKMDALVDERTGNVEKNLQKEIAAQKAERVTYLESLING